MCVRRIVVDADVVSVLFVAQMALKAQLARVIKTHCVFHQMMT